MAGKFYLPNRIQLSWSLFDFANSIFFVNVVSVYFPTYFVQNLGGSELAFTLVFALSQILTGLTAIAWGQFSDKTRRYRRLFVIFALLNILSTFLISFIANVLVLGVFLIAFYFFATTSIFYDTLLPGITSKKSLPIVAGIGGGLGLIGNIAALFVVAPFLEDYGIQSVFAITAITFLAFALPALLWVRPTLHNKTSVNIDFTAAFKNMQIWLKKFLIARILYGGSVVALIIHMPLMGSQLFQLSDDQIRIFYALVSIAAACGAFISGPLSNRISALKAMAAGLFIWGITQFTMALFLNQTLFYMAIAIGFFAGISLSADRIFFIKKSAENHLGENLGFHRLAYIGGGILIPVLFSSTINLFKDNLLLGYQFGLGVLAVLLIFSTFILSSLRKDS